MTGIQHLLLFLSLIFGQIGIPFPGPGMVPAGGFATPTSLHVTGGRCSTADSCDLTITATTAGSALFVVVLAASDATISVPTATGATFTCDENTTGILSHYALAVCSAPNVDAGITHVVSHFSGANSNALIVDEESGLTTSSMFDKGAGANIALQASPWASTASGTTTQTTELCLSAVADLGSGTDTLTGTGGWTILDPTVNEFANGNELAMNRQVITTTQSIQSTGTTTGAGSIMTSNVATYKAGAL